MHQTLLEWLILLGIFVLLAFVAWHEGLLQLLFSSDRSYLSWLISALFVVMTGHCGMRALSISTLLSQAEAAWHWRDAHPGRLVPAGDTVAVGEARMPVTRITRSAAELLCFPEARRELLEILSSEIKGGQEVGWYVSESMIRLGLLGTIIGFILMLGAVIDVGPPGVEAVRKILLDMSSGMATALYTTLAGLLASMMLSMQYYLVDRHADRVMELTGRLVGTPATPVPTPG